MSNEFYQEYIALIDKTNAIVTPITIDGDASGSLIPYRVELKLTGSGIKKTRNGLLILRSEDSTLFSTSGPILIDEATKNNYLIEARIDQDHLSATGELFRFELGKPILDATDKGLFITIPLVGIEYRLLESLDSEQLDLLTPHDLFGRRITNYFNHQGSSAPLVFFNTAGDNALPNDAILKQSQLPDGPKEVKKLLDEIIDRLANVGAGGGTFIDYFYWFEADPVATKSIKIFADVFGGNSTGITMDVLNDDVGSEQSQQTTVDNLKWKNVVIVRGPNGSHSYPPDHSKFGSDFEHSKLSDPYSAITTYNIGDFVLDGLTPFRSKIDSNTGNTPSSSPTQWENLLTTTRGMPWTNDLDVWYANMFGYSFDATHRTQGVSGGPDGTGAFIGCFADMNLVRADYDRSDSLNYFENVSFKMVAKMNVDNPTSLANLYDGLKVTVGSTPAGDFSTFTTGQIAEYLDNGHDTPTWENSNTPIFVNNGGAPDDEQDAVFDMQTGKIYKWNGSAWVVAWELASNEDVPSHLHPVKSMANVTGPTGITGSAVEFRFNVDFVADPQNKASRWCGFNVIFPFPRDEVHSSKFPFGHFYTPGTLDTSNLNKAHDGSDVGWNGGKLTEDLGRFRALSVKLRMGFFDVSNNELDYMTDIPVIFWFVDKFDRVVYKEIKLRRNNVWDPITFNIGPQSNFILHDNRLDELYRVLGFTFAHDIRLKEREHTGVKFDWRHVKGYGAFWSGSYDENFYYTGAEDSWLNAFQDRIKDIEKNLFAITSILFGRSAFTILDHTKCAIDEMHFLKDAYVTSETSINTDSRQAKEIVSTDPDYLNEEQFALGFKARKQFFPRFRNFNSYGDARMRLGETFIAVGTRVPESPSTFVCGEYTITVNSKGIRMETQGVKKFVVV